MLTMLQQAVFDLLEALPRDDAYDAVWEFIDADSTLRNAVINHYGPEYVGRGRV